MTTPDLSTAIDSLGDAHPHRRIAKDLEVAAQKLAHYDEAVSDLEFIESEGLTTFEKNFLRRARALQGGAK